MKRDDAALHWNPFICLVETKVPFVGFILLNPAEGQLLAWVLYFACGSHSRRHVDLLEQRFDSACLLELRHAHSDILQIGLELISYVRRQTGFCAWLGRDSLLTGSE